MEWSWSVFFRSLDALLLTVVLVFQAVALNWIFMNGLDTFSNWSYTWFVMDLAVLGTFYFTLYTVGCRALDAKKAKLQPVTSPAALGINGGCDGSLNDSNSIVSGTPANRKKSCQRVFNPVTKRFELVKKSYPLTYACWMFYTVVLVCKIVVLFMMDIAQELKKEEVFGPQMLKFAIGISALIFSLIVAAHKKGRSDPLRNDFLNNLCYRVALEVLDSASFISLLLPSESRLVYPYLLENLILALASLNLFLPCMTLYKLSSTDFGRKVGYPVETWYKFIHVILIDGSFFAIRVYLWSMFSTDTSIFMIKNLYSILNFGRELPKEFKDCATFCCGDPKPVEVEVAGRELARILGGEVAFEDMDDDFDYDAVSIDIMGGGGQVEMKTFRDRVRGANFHNKRDRSISTRGIHGSAQSSVVQVYAITEENGHANAVSSSTVVDESNSQVDLDDDDNASGEMQLDDETQTSAGDAKGQDVQDVPVRLRGSSKPSPPPRRQNQ